MNKQRKKVRNNKICFLKWKIEQRMCSKWKMQKRDKKTRTKKRRKEKGRNRIKRKTPTTFSKNEIFSKIKRCEKRGDTGIEHKRDVKHNSKLENISQNTKFGERQSTKES